ncbi:MAG TPA: hypothetical protein VKF32_11475 [Thermoanaerobaculia bacterium]|nr:hypothetical protein [Thermoanaerobaculia bacterium]
MKRTIVVAVPQVWGVRNVLRSGLHETLSRRFRVVLAVPEEGVKGLVADGIRGHDLLILPRVKAGRAQRWTLRFVKAAHKSRHRTVSDAILGGWHAREQNLKGRLLEGGLDLVCRAVATDGVVKRLEERERGAFLAGLPPEIDRFLDEEKPVLGLSTMFFLGLEWPLFRAMRARGIPTATQVLSFDNLTSRGWQPLAGFERFYVWQARMASELIRLYGIDPARIVATGTPQFDFHVRPEYRWSRERTMQALGLDPELPYLVHCANHRDLTPSEPELVASLVERLSKDPLLGRHQWVLRLHPLDDYARWDGLLERFPDVAVSRPWRQEPGSAVWGLPTYRDLASLGNVLRHASAALNIASTTALDAAMVDTPVVCVGYHETAPPRERAFYRDAHLSHHFLPIVQSGAAPLAVDYASLRMYLAEAVTRRDARHEARRLLVADLCGRVDGGAADRIAEDLVRLAPGGALEESDASPAGARFETADAELAVGASA